MPDLGIIDGKYALLRQLGEGGMGAVFEAQSRTTGRRVAVKVIAGERVPAEMLSRFLRETRVTGMIESQYVAHVLDAGVDQASGRPYLVMDLLRGEDLAGTLERLGRLPEELVLRMAAQACLGLAKAHEAGVVHRDIKPANMFLAERDQSEILLKLLDFGIAKITDEASPHAIVTTKTGALLGSPAYMSPEQARGNRSVGPATDIWSLGIVIYEALAGKSPYADVRGFGELIIQICAAPPPPLRQVAPYVSAATAAIVDRALALEPQDRFTSAMEMFDAIRALLPAGYALQASMIAPASAVTTTTDNRASQVEAAAPEPAPSITGSSQSTRAAVPLSKMVPLSIALVAALGIGGFWALRLRSTQAVVGSAPSATVDPARGGPPSAQPANPSPQAGSEPAIVAHPPATASVAAPLPRPSATQADKRPHTAPASKAGCNPPYSFDATGVKVWKTECF